jgi:hypothetical protein
MDVVCQTLCHPAARVREAALDLLTAVMAFRPTILRAFILGACFARPRRLPEKE